MDKTNQKIDTLISGFKNVVAYLLTQGFDVNRAIEEAYKLYPVMDGMKESIVDDMVKAFTSGYINAGVAVGVDTGDIPFSSESISTAMQKAWAKDNLNLSTRLHTRGQAVRKEVGDILKATIGKGNTNKKIASELFNRGVIVAAELPQFMDQVAKLPIDTSVEEKRKLLRKVQRQVSKRTTAGLRAGYSEVIKAVESDNQQKLDKAIEIATEEKTRYHAERIARTETARAYADGQVSRYKDDDDIVAFQWKLGTRHPVFDICDFYANADLYGMGKGVFPKDKVPTLPAHPHCMCRLKPIVDGMIDNSTPKENINDGGMDLIKSLSVKEQERLLGVHGRVAVLEGKARWQDHLRGWDNGKFEVRTPKKDYKRLKEGVKGVKMKPKDPILSKMNEIDLNTATLEDVLKFGKMIDDKYRIGEMLGDKDKIKEILGQYRIFGNVLEKSHIQGNREIAKILHETFEYYPSDWGKYVIENNRKIMARKVKRGFFSCAGVKNSGQIDDKLKGDPITDWVTIAMNGKRVTTPFHEIGHMVEFFNPNALKLSKEFLKKRTAGEDFVRMKDLFPFHGYSRTEETKKDNFITPYVGKEYEDASEVLSVGLESIFEPGDGKEYVESVGSKIRYKKINEDPEHLHLTLAMLLLA